MIFGKKNKKRKKEKKNKNLANLIERDIANGIWAIIFFVISLLFILSSLNASGMVGEYVFEGFSYLLGLGYFLIPLTFIVLGISFLRSLRPEMKKLRIVGSLILFLSGLGLIDLIAKERGGIIGNIISTPLLKLFDFYVSIIILVALVIISIIIIFEAKITLESLMFWRNWFSKKEKAEDEEYDEEYEDEEEDEDEENDDEEEEEDESEEDYDNEIDRKPKKNKLSAILKKDSYKKSDTNLELNTDIPNTKEYIPPPLSLLQKDKGKPGVGDIKANSNIIKRTLKNFGINVEMDEISIGPTVTRYTLKPAEGVRLSKILGLQNNLELALAAHPVRIEAPIPGKSLVGIEVPNSTKATVGLAGLLASEEYQKSPKPLLVSLGKSIDGDSHFDNLAKMPHVLIAGATGSGKSVTIHTVINSLLFRNSPENAKFIMVDPKRVELPLYNGIPHLLTPVITSAKKAILALKWAAKEMDRRYEILENSAVRDINSYHKNILSPALNKINKKIENDEEIDEEEIPEKMPYIVVVVDELADIMQMYPKELESAIVRLAQMSRAVGIHLILSTQRPSVNVITGLIKANIPARIALQVSSQIDSRTILDTVGAEKLLGAGDMLYLSSDMSKPIRLQSAFISENDVKSVVKYLKKEYEDQLQDEVNISSEENSNSGIFSDAIIEEDNDNLEDDDDLYEEAREVVIKAGKASTSYIQRKLRVGYSRAARLMDILEERGIIGPANGSKPREVLTKGDDEGYGEKYDEDEEYEKEENETR